MRVVHFGYSDVDHGASRAAYRLHRALRDLGVDSTMVVARRGSEDVTVVGPATPAQRLGVFVATRVEQRLKAAFDDGVERSLALLGSGVVQHIPRLRPDVVNLHWLGGGVVTPRGIAGLGGLPLVWRMPDMWPMTGTRHYAEPPGEPGGATILERLARRRKARAFAGLPRLTLVCPSRWLASVARSSPVFGDVRIEVIHTGVDLTRFRAVPRAAARSALGLPVGPAIVITGSASLGNPRKGTRELVAALRSLSRLHAGEVHVATFGEGSLPGTGLPTHTLGRIDSEERLATAYSAADVFVAPSLQENLANTVLEALACGTPVVAFDVGGMADALDGPQGYLAAPFDPEDLAAGIDSMLGDPQAPRHARLTAERRFDLVNQARRYVDVYCSMI